MHVVDPTRFPLATDAQYTPSPHTLADARAFYARFHWPIENMVLVQPSIYGADNSCMLEALRELTPRHGRAVVGLDLDLAGATTTTTTKGKSKSKDKDRYIDTLYEWHDLGVRGARVNLVSVGRDLSEAELCAELETYATLLRPLDWVLQLFIPMRLAVALESIVPDLGVRVCIDHFGWPALPKSEPYDPSTPTDPYALTGFRSLVNLLKKGQGQGNGNGNGKGQGNDNGSSNGKGNGKGQTWVKLSAPYRLARDPDMRDLDPIGRELVFQAPDRIVYATDWPHTRFDNVDPVPFVEKCFEWCGGDPVLIEKLFRTNAEQLWDIPGRKVTKSPQIETT
ncbi:hypothetical protein A1O3_06999 [Capronia epimyces CBS 606.96]|uniref:Amidohydrolase-related domain-containing protein n=1 Tax=Capronia epimyces CBS 606.96 TaxID=1182542 RepID=W9XTP2_9EURO|nr:uncharacterized protein A1O3_06999 [Capronia epimyces CBS 606.96]EXJ80715.1 hypothetical protein A1O3_06999 [Capronia epimyces CBS 606.96]